MIPLRNPVAVRLGKLAGSGWTGVVYLSGECGGVIRLIGGDVVSADSRGTPGLAARLAKAGVSAGLDGGSSLERGWLSREATVDAALELLSARTRARFRASGDEPGPGGRDGLPVPVLMAEVGRRYAVVRQMAALVTADTAVARNPGPLSRAIHVSGFQWAILIRAGGPATPRSLALELGQSVFSTTIEVFRMVTLNLLSAAGAPAVPAGRAGEFNRGRPAISFIRALAR